MPMCILASPRLPNRSNLAIASWKLWLDAHNLETVPPDVTFLLRSYLTAIPILGLLSTQRLCARVQLPFVRSREPIAAVCHIK
jgi:hypothetical protein